MRFTKKDILDVHSLDPAEITLILDTAMGMKEISRRPVKKVPTLRGKTIVLFFQEPSTRTKLSFEIAAKTSVCGFRCHHQIRLLHGQG